MSEKFDPITQEDSEQRKKLESLPPEELEKEIDRLHSRALLENTPALKKKAEAEAKDKEDLLAVVNVAESIKAVGGLALIVGGYARDEAMRKFGYDIEPKDIDVEVYGLSLEKLKPILEKFGEINEVGASFGVIKLTFPSGNILDFSLPRRDLKVSKGHKGFVVESDIDMTIREASGRRDFTINALALDPLTGEIIDKHGGLEDMENKIIRAVDKNAFTEDPLRVLRAAQFTGRFGFKIDESTIELAKKVDLSELSLERIGEEWVKLLLKSPKPSVGLEAMKEMLVLEKIHPEIAALVGVPQDPEWHPEGDVWTHTKLVADMATAIIKRDEAPKDSALVIMLSALCHDLGKPATTVKTGEGRITAFGHSEVGIEPTKKFLKNFAISAELKEKITALVKEHLFPLINPDPSPASVRRLAVRLGNATIEELVKLSKADKNGKGQELQATFPEGEVLLKIAHELKVAQEKPAPILLGRHLIEMGLKPGPKFGQILKDAYEKQLDGEIKNIEEAKNYVKSLNIF